MYYVCPYYDKNTTAFIAIVCCIFYLYNSKYTVINVVYLYTHSVLHNTITPLFTATAFVYSVSTLSK